MRLLMAVSQDGFTARGPKDDMTWTGREDKKFFRALTMVDGLCLVGANTYLPVLPGRTVRTVRRDATKLQGPTEIHFCNLWRLNQERRGRIWLLGGPTLAQACYFEYLIDEVHLIEIPVRLSTDETWRNMLPYVDQVGALVRKSVEWEEHSGLATTNLVHRVFRKRASFLGA